MDAPQPSKMEQIKKSGVKAKETVSNMASNAGKGIMNLLKKSNTTPSPNLTELDIQKQKMESQVTFFIFLLLGILVFVGIIFVSKTFRVYTTLHRLEIYQSQDIMQKSICEIKNGSYKTKKLRDFYIASAYRPYVCKFHKYDYCSLEVLRQVLCAGPRMIELEIFNDSFSLDVEPVVSSGTEEGEWKMAINSLPLPEVLKIIAGTVFNYKYVKDLKKDPFIIYLNLKVNRNLKCLEKISKYIFQILGNYLLNIKYSYNSNTDTSKFNEITLGEVESKIIIFASSGFEGTPLEEVVNYSSASDYTLENNPNQYRILYLKNGDIVEKEEDIEEYSNSNYYKVTKDNLKNYNNCGFTILSPNESMEDSGFFTGISPNNPEPTKALESGCQFIMMNYQLIDTNMSNYAYIFKDSSFVEKLDKLDNSNTCDRKFSSVKTEKIKHTNKEVVYTYVTENK